MSRQSKHKMSNSVAKMQAKEERALKLPAPAEPFVYKSNTQRKKEAFSFRN